MMLVETFLAPSSIDGIGLFSFSPIKKGTRLWQIDHRIDRTYIEEKVEQFPSLMRGFIHRYAYHCTHTGLWILCGDNGRFFNHSDAPNTMENYKVPDPFGIDIAARDIAAGEELTTNYEGFDAKWHQKLAA